MTGLENDFWESWKEGRFADLGQEHKFRKTKQVPKCLPRRSTFTWQSLGLTSEKLIPGVKTGEKDLKYEIYSFYSTPTCPSETNTIKGSLSNKILHLFHSERSYMKGNKRSALTDAPWKSFSHVHFSFLLISNSATIWPTQWFFFLCGIYKPSFKK